MSPKRSLALVFLVLAGAFAGRAEAQCEIDTFAPADSGFFGNTLVMEGDTAVVAAPGSTSHPHAVYVYVRTGGQWIQQQKLSPSDGRIGVFGGLVALSGDTLAVGGNRERAYVFVRTTSGWVEQQSLELPGAPRAWSFGHGVWLDGDTLVVSAPTEGTPATTAGAAYVYVRSGGVWSLQQRLQPRDVSAGGFCGLDAALSGDELLLGCSGKDAVYRFTRSGTSWQEQEKLTASGGRSGDSFGIGLALDGDTLLIRSAPPTPLFTYTVHVFERSGGLFLEQQRIDVSAPSGSGSGSYSTAISGDTFVIASRFETVDGIQQSGAAYVFSRSGSVWRQTARLLPTVSRAQLFFGSSVALSNDTLLIGAAGDDGAGAHVGRVHVYELPGASVTYHNGRGINVDTLATTPAAVRQTWTATLGVTAPHTAGLAYLAVHRACQPGVRVLGGGAEFLLAGQPVALLGPTPHAGQGSSVPFTLAIPPNAALVGLPWAAQGVILGGTTGLTNAATGRVQ
ncbi:MAG TPA: hypothetical protein VF530_14060 [Planctomycetota bacterium]